MLPFRFGPNIYVFLATAMKTEEIAKEVIDEIEEVKDTVAVECPREVEAAIDDEEDHALIRVRQGGGEGIAPGIRGGGDRRMILMRKWNALDRKISE